MKKFWSVLLKVATWGLGHQAIIAQTVADAKAKNLEALVVDALTIKASVPK